MVRRVDCRIALGQTGWWRGKVVGVMKSGKGWNLGLVEARLAGCIAEEVTGFDLPSPRGWNMGSGTRRRSAGVGCMGYGWDSVQTFWMFEKRRMRWKGRSLVQGQIS